MEHKIYAQFTIPEELAKELSTCLTQNSIKKSLLIELVEFPAKYEIIEKQVIELEDHINAIKNVITTELVPEEYRQSKYSWNYNG